MNAGSHKIVGYDESTSQVVAAQHSQMINLGYWAVSPDWYGTSTLQSFITVVGVEATDLANRSGYPLKLLVMIDGNSFLFGTNQSNSICPQGGTQDQTTCITADLKNYTDYVSSTYAVTFSQT